MLIKMIYTVQYERLSTFFYSSFRGTFSSTRVLRRVLLQRLVVVVSACVKHLFDCHAIRRMQMPQRSEVPQDDGSLSGISGHWQGPFHGRPHDVLVDWSLAGKARFGTRDSVSMFPLIFSVRAEKSSVWAAHILPELLKFFHRCHPRQQRIQSHLTLA